MRPSFLLICYLFQTSSSHLIIPICYIVFSKICQTFWAQCTTRAWGGALHKVTFGRKWSVHCHKLLVIHKTYFFFGKNNFLSFSFLRTLCYHHKFQWNSANFSSSVQCTRRWHHSGRESQRSGREKQTNWIVPRRAKMAHWQARFFNWGLKTSWHNKTTIYFGLKKSLRPSEKKNWFWLQFRNVPGILHIHYTRVLWTTRLWSIHMTIP